MSFIYPSFLWALGLIIIPILIHIINLRKHRTVYFSNVNFLKKVRKQTQRKSKLKQLLILASRILLIIMLVTAFAKPYIPTGNTEKQRANNVVGIYIDNSFSMNAEGPEGKAIENAKQKAYAIVNGSKPNSKFALLTNELSEIQNRFYSQSEIIKLIGEVEENHHWVMMSTVMLRFQNMMKNFLFKTDKTIYVISDFQRFSSDLTNFKADSLNTYNFVPVPVNSVTNLYIDTCWFDAPTHHLHQVELLNVRIVNRSNSDYPQLPVNFYINDSLKALATIQIDANEQKVVSMQYTNTSVGVNKGRVEISDYPIVYDNDLYLSYEVKSELKALLIETDNLASNKNISAIFSNDDYIKLDRERADRLQISMLNNYSAIILNEVNSISSGLSEELSKYVKNGGTLITIPSERADVNSYNRLFEAFKVSTFDLTDTIAIPINQVLYQHAIYKDVFKDQQENVAFPVVKKRYRTSVSQQSAEEHLLSFADDSPALTASQSDKGKFFRFTFSIADKENEFLNHLLFLPTIYNMVLQSSHAQKIYYVLGQDQSFELQTPEQEQNITIKHLSSNEESVPKIILQEGNQLRIAIDNSYDAGFYQLQSGNSILGAVAFNYLLNESNLSYYQGNEIMQLVKQTGIESANLIEGKSQNMAEAINELDNGKQLWKLFIMLAILFLLCETAIIRFWK